MINWVDRTLISRNIFNGGLARFLTPWFRREQIASILLVHYHWVIELQRVILGKKMARNDVNAKLAIYFSDDAAERCDRQKGKGTIAELKGGSGREQAADVAMLE